MNLEPSAADESQRKNGTVSKSKARPLAALRHRNFRIYWLGQAVSLVGTWIQNVAMAWLVLELTNSPLLLGLMGAALFAPILLFSLPGGVLADRVSRRRLIIATQSSMMLGAFILGFLTFTGLVEYWQVLSLAFLMGTASAIDIPARQSFLIELTGRKDLMNAIALHASVFNAARFIGPAVGGLLIAGFSLPVCFFINGVSFMAVLAGLLIIRVEDQAFNSKVHGRDVQKVWTEVGEGLNYIRTTPALLYPIILMALLSLLTFNLNVLVPVYARDVLHQGADGFGFLMGAHGLGALLGAFYLAYVSHRGPQVRMLFAGALGLCLAQLALAFVHLYWLAWSLLLCGGLSMMIFVGLVNATVQLAVPDHLRGRVMSVYVLVFLGMMPFGSLVAGMVAQFWGVPVAFFLSAALGLFSLALLARRLLRSVPRQEKESEEKEDSSFFQQSSL